MRTIQNKPMKSFFSSCVLTLLIMCLSLPVFAEKGDFASPDMHIQENDTIIETSKELLSEGTFFHVPHWYLKAQGGLAFDVGEAEFSQLLSPALQLSAGYQLSEFFGLRASVNGLWARNRYAYPEAKYSWNFLQGTIDAELNLTALFLGSKHSRNNYAYVFAGVGASYAFNNDDAVEADKRYGIDFQKLWKKSRWNPVVKFGLGYDYYVTDQIAVGAEMNAQMLPDHFNSKRGRGNNRDWHFNALVGVKFALGSRYGRTEARYNEVVTQTIIHKPDKPKEEPKEEPKFVDVPVEKISFNVNIHFVINQSIIRSNQISKLTRLLRYLDAHPRAFVRLSGYADKDTGTPEINLRLSRERSEAVSQYLQDAGIEEWRIRRFAKGDRVQPFDIPADNRVCICFVYDPDNPVPMQDNW